MNQSDLTTNDSLQSILIVHSNPEFAKDLLASGHAQFGFSVASNREEIQKIFNEQNTNEFHEIKAIFLQLSPRVAADLETLHTIRRFLPVTPIFQIPRDDKDPLGSDDLRDWGLQGIYTGDVAQIAVIEEMVSLPRIYLTDRTPAPAAAKTKEDLKYVAIRIDAFFGESGLHHEVFLRLSAGHYVKFLNAGDRLSMNQLKRYSGKGIFYFYIQREDQESLLKRLQNKMAESINDPSSTGEVKVQNVMEYGETTMRFLTAGGFQESQLKFAHGFVQSTQKLISQLGLNERESVQAFLKDTAAYDHAVSTTMVTALICQLNSVEPDFAREVIGTAAMLHDVGLQELPEELHHEDESLMTPEQKILFRKHPIIGAQIVRSIPSIKEGIVEIVLKHHQRRNQSGFPTRRVGEATNRLAELVGAADALVQLIAVHDAHPRVEPISLFKTQVLPGLSKSTQDAYLALLAGRRSKQ